MTETHCWRLAHEEYANYIVGIVFFFAELLHGNQLSGEAQ